MTATGTVAEFLVKIVLQEKAFAFCCLQMKGGTHLPPH